MEASDIFLLILAVPGLLISFWFTLVTYGILPADARAVPRFCRMDERSCASILHTPQARVLRIAPNAVFGTVWYGVVIVVTLLSPSPMMNVILIGASWLTVLLSAWLAWSLRFRLRAHCPLCYTSHLLNLGIALILSLR